MKFNVNPPSYGIKPPCMECEVREPACHDKCEMFKEYRNKLQKAKDREFAEKMSERIRPTAPKRKGIK